MTIQRVRDLVADYATYGPRMVGHTEDVVVAQQVVLTAILMAVRTYKKQRSAEGKLMAKTMLTSLLDLTNLTSTGGPLYMEVSICYDKDTDDIGLVQVDWDTRRPGSPSCWVMPMTETSWTTCEGVR